MKKKVVVVIWAVLVLASLLLPSLVHGQPFNPYELVIKRVAGDSPVTLDPANCYDMASAELLSNVYEPLIFSGSERYDVFMSRLATQVWVAPPDPAAPPYTNFTIYLEILTGVMFHNWCRSDLSPTPTWSHYYLSTDDVEHSFERWMVYDYLGGPQWMIYEPLLSTYQADPAWPSDETNPINLAVESNNTHAWLNIANRDLTIGSAVPFTPVALFDASGHQRAAFWDEIATLPVGYALRILLQVLAQSWASIMSKQWLLSYVDMLAESAGHPTGEWPGTWENWTLYNYALSPLLPQLPCVDIIPGGVAYPGMTCGTGPYVLDRFDPALEWSAVKFDDYWGGWPADWPNLHGYKPAGWVTRVTVKYASVSICVNEFIEGLCDFIYVPRSQWPSLHLNGDIWKETRSGIRLQYCQAPELRIYGFYFTFDITPTLGGLYGQIYDCGVLSEDGIPRDFFKDIHVRKAFAYCINFTYLINDVLQGIDYQPVTFAPSGLPYVNPAQDHYSVDEEKAKEQFALAWDGQLINIGFSLTLCYWGSMSQALFEYMATRINNIGSDIANGKFHVQCKQIPWIEYGTAIPAHKLPTFLVGWLADYADIHSFVLPLSPSYGIFAQAQKYNNATVDKFIDDGLHTPDGPLRQAIYYQLEELFYEDVPSVPLYASITRRYMRDWVYGHYYNALYPGIFAYNIWKWGYRKGDVNYDGKLSMSDIVTVVSAFGSYAYKTGTFVIHPRWSFHCDIDDSPRYRWRDQKIDMGDFIQICSTFGQIISPWQPPP